MELTALGAEQPLSGSFLYTLGVNMIPQKPCYTFI